MWVPQQVSGSASYANGVYTVNGAGIDIYGANDQFHYVYQPVNGNGTLIARVTSQTNTSANAKAGSYSSNRRPQAHPIILIAAAPGGAIKVSTTSTVPWAAAHIRSLTPG